MKRCCSSRVSWRTGAQQISKALAAAKARGTTRDGRSPKLSNYARIAAAKQAATRARAESVRPAIEATAYTSANAAVNFCSNPALVAYRTR